MVVTVNRSGSATHATNQMIFFATPPKDKDAFHELFVVYLAQ
jgi:hypothetical protein